VPGGQCQTAPVFNGSAAVNGSIPARGIPHYFTTNVADFTTRSDFEVVLTSGSEVQNPQDSTDLVVSLRQGSAPIANESTTFNYDNGKYFYSITSPLAGLFVVEVQNNVSTAVNFTVSITSKTCGQNEYGDSCLAAEDLTNVNKVQNKTGPAYFTVTTNQLVFGVADSSNSSLVAPSVYASFTSTPTSDRNIVDASGKTTNFVNFEAPTQVTWIIFVDAGSSSSFYYWANIPCPNNCQGDDYNSTSTSSNGKCDESTGVCTCDKKYNEIFCEKESGLAAGWIVLIVIACAIVLAVVVGVPIGCYIRSKSKARYERV